MKLYQLFVCGSTVIKINKIKLKYRLNLISKHTINN